MNLLRLTQFAVNICLAVILTTACEKKTDELIEEINIEFSYNPNPATVNTEITMLFELESTSDHLDVSMVTSEIGKEGETDHHELILEKEPDHEHYEGVWTFVESGTYELHFAYKHDEEMNEKEFEIVVVDN